MAQALVAYTSSGDEDDERAGAASSSEDSYFRGSDAESEDSATRRRREAESRITDAEVSSAGRAELPDPLSALGQMRHKPAFLTPEATKPIAAPLHRSRPPPAPAQPDPAANRSNGGASTPFDIASMAPPLKGDASKRGHPEGAVISAAPKRYKPADEDGGVITAAQIAMLGGQWKPSADDGNDNDGGPPALGPAAPAHLQQQRASKPSKPMGVSDFLDKGVGGAQLPRRRQERKDKEKNKRQLGQSAIGSWKTEAEMVLRQQYDS